MADDNTSVGKISLDLELTSDLSKQVEQAASNIGDQLKTALQGLDNLNFKGLSDNLGKQMTSSIEDSMKAMQRLIEQNLSKALEAAMANIKAIKIPVEFGMPTNMAMPNQPVGMRIPQPRGPPMPKMDTSVNMEALKAQIDNLAQSLDITNAKIEQQQSKLAGLKESYSQAFDGTRKNQLQEQILKTEEVINKLTATSNKTGFALADLDDQFARLSNASKSSGNGITSFMDKLKGIADIAGKIGGSIKNVGNSMENMGNSMDHARNHSYGFFNSMIQWGIIFPMIMNGLTAVGTYISSTFMANEKFSNSLNQIRSNLMTAYMPIYQAILPALNALVNSLATATAYIASFTSQLFGKTYQQSFASAQAMQNQIGAMDIAQKQAKKAADSLGGVGKSATNSADATKKAAKEIKGALAGFDEINQLNLSVNKTPKVPTPAGSGVITPITPMANMDPIEAATSGWANKFRNILANLWKPFQQAWAVEGQNTINAAKHALGGILDLLGAIGKSFYIVWTNGTGERILVNILKILQDVLNIIGDIGVTFANAWNKGNIGTQVVQSLVNAFNNVLSLIDKMLQAVRTVWGQEGPKFADMFMQALKAGSGVIENITQKLGLIWDNGGQHAFEGLVKLGLKVGELALFIFTNFVAPFVNWFVNMISPAIATGLNWIGKLSDTLSNLIDWLMGTGRPTLDAIVKVVGAVFLAFKTWEGIKSITNGVKTTISTAKDSIDSVQKSLDVAGKSFNTFKGFVSDTKSVIADFGSKTLGIVSNGLSKVGNLAKIAGSTLLDFGKSALNCALDLAKMTAELAKQAIAWVAQKAALVASTIAQVACNIATSIWTIVCGIATIATTAFGIAVAFLTSPIGLVVIAIGALIAIGIILYKNWDQISAFLIQCWNGIVNTGGNIWNKFTNFLSNLWGNISGTANNAWNGFRNIVSNLVQGTVNNAINIWNGLLNWFANLPGNFRNLGVDMINALGDGIRNTVNNVVNIAKDLGNRILQGIKDIFGIHSPSREMFKIGNFFVQGFTNALNGNDIGSMVKDVFGDITGLAKGALGGPLGVVLKPMLDSGAFGKVGGLIQGVAQNGASFLGSLFGGGGASGDVSSWLQSAMAITGTPMQYLPMLENIAQHESGGDPRSINLWDSNAQAGHPSKGLMQMIDETFNRYAMSGMNDIYNPIDNAVSAIRYMIGRYGNIANVPGIRSQMNGGSYVGYATGTNSARKGLAMTGEVGPEMIDFSGGEMVLNLKNTIGLINSAVGAISNIKNAVTGTIQQPQLTMARSNSSSVSQNASDFAALKNAIIEAIREDRQQNNDNVVKLLQMILDIIKNLGMDIDIDGDKLARIVIKQLNRRTRMTGKTELIL